MRKKPCLGCTERNVTATHNCHTNCPNYAEQVADCKKRRDYNNGISADYMNYKQALIDKKIRRKNEQNRGL